MWIHKLQQLPEKKRKMILWGVLAVIAFLMIVWWGIKPTAWLLRAI